MVASQSPKVGMLAPDDPHATSSMAGSTSRIALAVSAATLPYSAAVLWPICQSPSISLPRHHTRTSCGSAAPFFTRWSDQYVPPGWLQYSTSSAAASRASGAQVYRQHRRRAHPSCP